MNRDERTTATLYAARCNVEASWLAGRAKDGERDERQGGKRAKRKEDERNAGGKEAGCR